MITRTKFELRSETIYTEVDERNKAGEQYSKKIFYTEVEKRNQAQIYSYQFVRGEEGGIGQGNKERKERR